MGDWSFTVRGVGAHKNADRLAVEFVRKLQSEGHTIAQATFCNNDGCQQLIGDLPKQYEMKDLGYTRTPTTAEIQITMESGAIWGCPAQMIAAGRDKYYHDRCGDLEDTVRMCRDTEDNYELIDWLQNNMNWSEIREYARLVKMPITTNESLGEDWGDEGPEIVGTV